ncbi:MAG: sensor histidine kinase [Clostridiales bacterium]|nr:sensor histidine kinase [Clostridiales bacterium]
MKWLHKHFHGLYWRQMAVTVGMVALTLVLMGVSFFSLSYNYARDQRTDELLVRAQAVSKLSVRYLETGRYLSMEELQEDEQFRQLAATAAVISEMDILVCDTDGHVLLSTDETMAGQSINIPQSVMEKVLSDGTWSGRSRLDQIYQNKQFIGGVAVVNPTSGKTLGAVFTVSTSASIDDLWRAFAGLLLMTAFVVLMISFMASSITTMRQIKPIREMAQATRQYAEGDFDIRMNDYGREDEIGELAASFNNMAESLQQTERQRREFIANISHELKTPMTTIAGYTDGILDGTIPPENEKQYLQIIANESRRLSRLVRRMLDVSQLQAMDPLRGGNHFDICESMRRVLISMEKKINDRHLDVDADIPDEPILVLGDNDMITQVIYNLLENAAKFAREGSTLYLGVAMMDGKARVTVRNIGDTIPAEELPLLFERFHKSDKSRSEDKDGYGLGLYIVKTILQQHKEEINVTSENGVTTFTFSLRVE